MGEKSFDALRVLETAKEVERRSQAFYEEAAKAASDQKVKGMFLTLAQDEATHITDLERIGEGLEKTFPALSRQVDVGSLTTRFKDLLFPEDPSRILSDTSKLTEMQALERGIQLERESIELYEDAAEKETSPGASNAFRRLVMEERMHLFILNLRLDLLKLRS